MRRIGSNLQKRRVIMALLTLVLMNTGCDERFDNPAVNPSEEKTVEVSMAIGFADEADACNLSASTKANANAKGKGAFDVELVPTVATRADAAKPAKLYKLEIRQYNQSGDCYTSSGQAPADQIIGERFSISLTKDADCQLVFVAWGKDNSAYSLGTGTLTNAQNISITASYFNNITPTDMSKMPYVLHLKHVKVTSDGKITNPDGEDVRILLKRLATRLNISWDYAVTGYDLKQIILQSIPRNYKVVPAPDEKSLNTYPSLMDQYADIQLTTAQINATNKSYSCWIPANVRGINTVSNGPQYRIKENAPTGSSYVSFIATNSADTKKKLNYRIYLGGKDYSDYNLNENTDYSYNINFKHIGLPVDDKRVTIIDPIPASENNENFLPTANCFMVAPGGAFCFDPFAFQQNGKTITNSTLKGWSDSEGGIAYVKLLWQTKENGDVGDPTIGVVNSSDDHTNIVDIKKNGGAEVSQVSTVMDINQARIYCRVAPNTTGGSGLIAAYNKAGDILWSWHIWVTDYAPTNTGSQTVLNPKDKRKFLLYKKNDNGDIQQSVIMDRNLGAYTGYVEVPGSILDMSKANGFHYQKGRKDPFPGSYTSENLPSVYSFTLSKEYPPKHMLNRYEGDGITWIIPVDLGFTSLRNAYKNPISIARNNTTQWCSDDPLPQWEETKTFNDPCPAGWRAPKRSELQVFVDYSQSFTNAKANGGLLLKYDETENRTYIRFTGYPPHQSQLNNVGINGYLTACERSSVFAVSTSNVIMGGNRDYDAHTTRCIQERE